MLNMEKSALREQYKLKRKQRPQEEKHALDLQIQCTVLTSDLYFQAEEIFTYVSTPQEIDTLGILHAALSNRKRVAVPYCIPGTNAIKFYYIAGKEELHRGAFGILEPDPAKCEEAFARADTLCLVPGLAFDAAGYRLGYGKGYYDRFLSEFPGRSMGLCSTESLVLSLPADTHDQKVAFLATEKFIRKTEQEGLHA